mgnify:CR=1 FL=1
MSMQQAAVVGDMLTDSPIDYVLHGGCRGADSQFDSIALSLGLPREIWPGPGTPCSDIERSGSIRIMDSMPYLQRNREIVTRCAGLIATPSERLAPLELRKGGTWYTIRHAFIKRTPVVIVWPCGEAEPLLPQ